MSREEIVGYQDEYTTLCSSCANLIQIGMMTNITLEDGIADCLGWCDRCGEEFWYTADSVSIIFIG